MSNHNNAIGLGATLEVDDGTLKAYVAVVDLLNLTPPDYETGTVESKRLNLTGRTLVKKAALNDPGEFTFEYEHSAAKKARFDTLQDGTSYYWRVILPATDDESGSTWKRVVPGFVKSNKVNQVQADGIMTVTCTVVVTGAKITTDDSATTSSRP